MSDVTVIGLGNMGSALARVLVENGRRVTVWNRSSDKAASLVERGGILAPDIASAVSASPVIIVCVANYDVSRDILAVAREQFAGRVLVQLSTGTPGEARAGEAWANAAGAAYLDGAIMNYPSAIGTPNATIYLSGAATADEAARPLLELLAENLLYKGERAGLAAAWDCALLSEYYGLFLSFFHAVQICEAEGIPLEEYAEVLGAEGNGFLQQLALKVQSGDHQGTQAKLETWANGIERIAQHAHDVGIDASFPMLSLGLFQKAVAAGYGDEEVSALIKVLRAGRLGP